MACVIYIMVHYKVRDMQQILTYFSFLYERDLQDVLGAYQVDSYRVDLEVAFEYLSQPAAQPKPASLRKIDSFA